MDRRAALGAVMAVGLAPLAAACTRERSAEASKEPHEMTRSEGARMPAVFLAHGAPPLVDDPVWVAELARWARAMPRPKAVLVLSAHWEAAPLTLGATRTVPLVYDFYGFPRRYYETTYAAPGAPELARRVRELVGAGVASDEARGLDHGAYVPLLVMYPGADVPVLQASLPSLDPRALFELGRTLAPLRDEGVLLLGSGFITHNLRAMRFEGGPTPRWAADFDAWTADVVARRDVGALLAYRERAPGVRESLPTHEHFVPLLVAAGASIDAAEPVAFPVSGFAFAAGSKRSVQFG
jgi:4,5-DOPA dioxygenase extradiol